MSAPPTPLLCGLREREEQGGQQPVRFWRDVYAARRLAALDASRRARVLPAAGAALTWLDLDGAQQRYLLASRADGGIDVYDARDAGAAAPPPGARAPVARVAPAPPAGCHRFAVSAAAWYPVDSGIFVSAGLDHDVKVWDANALAVAATFTLHDRVNTIAMSPAGGAHCLVAAGLRSAPHAVLVDVASGAATHTLTGHRGGVAAAAWSAACEHTLVTGDAAGQLREFDVRRAGCRRVLDMHATTRRDAGVGRGGGRGAAAAAHRRRARNNDDDAGPGGSSGAGRYAHDGAVTSVLATPDGRHWLSAGADARLRLWDAASGCHLLVHYDVGGGGGGGTSGGDATRPRRMATTPDGRHAFWPSGDGVCVFDVLTGRRLARLRHGHYDAVAAAAWSEAAAALFTAGADGAVVVWEPRAAEGGEGDVAGDFGPGLAADVDAWSDDDGGGGGGRGGADEVAGAAYDDGF